MVDRVWFCSSWQFNAPASFLRLLTVADCVRVMSEKVNVRWVRVRGRGCVGVCVVVRAPTNIHSTASGQQLQHQKSF